MLTKQKSLVLFHTKDITVSDYFYFWRLKEKMKICKMFKNSKYYDKIMMCY